MSAERLAASRERAQRDGFWRHLGSTLVATGRATYMQLASRPPAS